MNSKLRMDLACQMLAIPVLRLLNNTRIQITLGHTVFNSCQPDISLHKDDFFNTIIFVNGEFYLCNSIDLDDA